MPCSCLQTPQRVHTLSAMTAGIRRNWIQALMKNVRPSNAPSSAPSNAPDVARYTNTVLNVALGNELAHKQNLYAVYIIYKVSTGHYSTTVSTLSPSDSPLPQSLVIHNQKVITSLQHY